MSTAVFAAGRSGSGIFRFVLRFFTLVLVGICSGADIWAGKMEIVKSDSGYATVLRDSVVMTDEDSKLVSRRVVMDERAGFVKAFDSVVITTPEAIVFADSAIYQLRARTAELHGRVRVSQESLNISASRLLYVPVLKRVQTDSEVVLENLRHNCRLTGRRAAYSLDSGCGTVDSVPVLTLVGRPDSTRVTSHSMAWDERIARASAAGDVRVSSGRGELTCDSAFFYAGGDSGVAWGGATVCDSFGKVSGDTIVFAVCDGMLVRVAVHGNANGSYLAEGGNVVKVGGNHISLWLDGGDIDRVAVEEMTGGEVERKSSLTKR